ncbi:MAG: hypothetical protein WA765_21925 [Candidatus Acidiferrum sp.]
MGNKIAAKLRVPDGSINPWVNAVTAALAVIENFIMPGVVFLAVIPALLMMRKPKAATGGVPVH